MAEHFGYDTALWFKESASFGSVEDMSTGTRYALYVKPGVSLGQRLTIVETSHIRGSRFTQASEKINALESIDGAFGGVIPYGGAGEFGILLKHLLGKVTTGDPAAGIYTHTYKWNDLVFDGLSFAHNKIGATYNHHGCQLESLKLSTNIGEPLTFEFGVVGKNEAVVAAITAVAPTAPMASNAYMMGHHCVIEVANNPIAFTGFDLEYVNGIDVGTDKAYQLGLTSPVNLIPVGGIVSGTLRRRAQKDAGSGEATLLHELVESDVNQKLEFTFMQSAAGDYYMAITIFAKLHDPVSVPGDQGIISEEVSFTGIILDDADAGIVINDASEYPVTATGAYNG